MLNYVFVRMKCAVCGFENPDNFKFCGECGSKLKNICPNCGFENPPNFKFCGECGTKLVSAKEKTQHPEEKKKDEILRDIEGRPTAEKHEKPQESLTKSDLREPKDIPIRKEFKEEAKETAATAEADKRRTYGDIIRQRKAQSEPEKRPVSVLFADISGFTAISERLDPEELRAFIGDILNKLAEIVRKNGGYVDKFMGDAIMALFGAPQAMGDDTKRAVETAYEMMDFIRSNYKEVSLHGGIATGEVVVGSISDRPQDYTAIGDTVNIAKRLEEESKSWQFLVDENTYVITSRYFEYRYVGDIKLKGKTKDLKVYELVGKRTPTYVLIGREREFSKIMDSLSKGYSFFGIYGEPGVGISYFIDHLHVNLKNSYKFVASDHGFFGTLRDIISHLLDFSEDKESKIIRISQEYNVSPHFLGYIFGVIFPESPLRYLTPEQIENETFNTLFTLMNKIFRDKVIIIDSFSDADRYTKKFFINLPELLPNFSIVVGFDKGSLDANSFPAKWQLMELSNFDLDETKKFLFHLSGGEITPDDELVMTIYSVTEGNPLFISELYELLNVSGCFYPHSGTLKLKSGVVIPKAVGIRQVILSKIDKLPQGARTVLEVLSCMSIQNKDVLYKFFENDLMGFSKAIEILKQSAFIEEEDDFFVFRQNIYRDVAYDKILKSKRYEIHSKLFESASSIADEDLEIISIAVEQAEKSERFTDAFKMAKKGGMIAKSKLNFAQVVFFFEKAYEVLKKLNEPYSSQEAYEFYMEFGESMYHTGDFQKAKQLFEEAEGFANNEYQRIGAIRYLADCLQMLGEFDRAEKIYRDILRSSEGKEKLKSELIKTLALLCHLFVDRGDPHKGVEFGLRALEICDQEFKERHKEIYSDVINSLGRAYLSMGDVQKAKKMFMEFYELSLKIDNQRIRGVAISNYAVSLYSIGELESALIFFKQYYELSKSIMDVRGTAIALINIAQVLFEIGRVDEALYRAKEALEIFKRIGDKYGTAETLEVIATMRILLGDYEGGRRIIQEELIPGTESSIKKSRYNLLIAMCAIGENLPERTKEHLDRARELNQDITKDVFYNIVLSRVSLNNGELETAYNLSKKSIEQSRRDPEKIFAILNFLKIASHYEEKTIVLQDEVEKYESELKTILSKFPDFSLSSFKFFA